MISAKWNATAFVALVALAAAPSASAQASDPLTAGAKAQFTGINSFIVRSAEKIPDALYSFQPTPEVRTVAQLYGHIADAYFEMCSTAGGGTAPRNGIEKAVRTKAELVKALNEGAAYCQSVIGAMNDRKGAETVPFYFGPTPRLSVLYFTVTHSYEHYGNLVTYMRLNKIVPPSSEPPPATAR
jgi:uncharacterized damage-inducible protein DinB